MPTSKPEANSSETSPGLKMHELEPFSAEWRLRLTVAAAELEALLRDQRQLEKERDRWPRLYTP